MDVLTTSLEALLQRATNPQNQNPDTAAIEAFSVLINKEHEGSIIGVRLLANKIQSLQEKEALQALSVLDYCMKHCNQSFHMEVGKFRFLNEMIKLVSPKYLGSRTPPSVRSKVLNLLYSWVQDYPRETKIKEAFEMLKKQGVVKDEMFILQPHQTVQSLNTNTKNTVFEDDEKSRLLQKLLRSKNPDDLQAANRLIKTMVKEEERRVEMISRRSSELEAVHNNARLLSEMLDSYRPGQSSASEFELIKELHQSCERLRPVVFRLATETQHNEEMLNQVLQASDELGQVFEKYTQVIVQGKISENKPESIESGGATSLVDLNFSNDKSTSNEESLLDFDNLLSKQVSTDSKQFQISSDIDALSDLFDTTEILNRHDTQSKDIKLSSILKPVNILENSSTEIPDLNYNQEGAKTGMKIKGFEDLDALGESLIKQNLTGASRIGGQFKKPGDKIPMNLLTKPIINESLNKTISEPIQPWSNLVTDSSSNINLDTVTVENQSANSSDILDLLNGDDTILNLSDSEISLPTIDTPVVNNSVQNINPKVTEVIENKSLSNSADESIQVKPLTDLFVTLESIKPSAIPPLSVLDNKNGISVILHFAKDGPRSDVSVVVVSTISKNTKSLTNYLFQAVVPKSCKLKLQPPSSSELPAYNPFLPPAAITQVILVANPTAADVSLKFMISYTMEDETITEMGEVDKLPTSNL